MHLGEPANNRTKLWVRVLLGALALIFIIAFFKEIWDVVRLFWTLGLVVLLGFPYDGVDLSAFHSFSTIMFNCIFGFGLFFFLWLILISSQALLPVSNVKEIYRTAWHLWLYITGQHGPAVFVKDGKEVFTQADVRRRGHGVIVVDFNSAVVLEERGAPPGLSRLMNKTSLNMLSSISLSDPPESPRVCGPGIVFTRPGERIRGAVDLRGQFRRQANVNCYTREGIELYANINAIFSVGQNPEPDALQVTYVGEPLPENLRVCVFSEVPGGEGQYLRLSAVNDELEADDCREIHHFAKVLRHTENLRLYEPLPQKSAVPVFDRERVFAAVFAQARDSKQEVMPWTDLPTRVAAGYYRELLQQINYDELYDIRGNANFPLPQHKQKLKLRMRNNGILAYRLIYHQSGAQLVAGNVYPKSELVVSEIRKLTTSKLLRDRGIKVTLGSFGDLFPVSSLIYKQRLDSWRAGWERDLDITRAGRDLQAMRTRSRALSEAQQDLWYGLTQLFSVQENTDEALAIQVMQALESAAADPKTRQLLPGQTIDLMRHIQALLRPAPQISSGGPALPPSYLNIPGGQN